jgi:3-deoxy-D-manno-octulosonic acid (KDO) 8-phosphate synthase
MLKINNFELKWVYIFKNSWDKKNRENWASSPSEKHNNAMLLQSIE